jgi:hypothetical protein
MNCIRANQSLHIVCEIELVPDFNKLQLGPQRERPKMDLQKVSLKIKEISIKSSKDWKKYNYKLYNNIPYKFVKGKNPKKMQL